MSDDLEHLSEEEFAAIGAILEGSENRRHGEHILELVARTRQGQGPAEDLLLHLLRQAHQASLTDADKE